MEKSKRSEAVFYVERLAVLPEERHRGHGRRLMAHAIHEIQKSGGKAVTIGLMNKNKVLKRWYSRQGFVQTEVTKLEHLPFKVRFMSKDLGATTAAPGRT